jgi:hypothetical protein
MSGPVTGTVTEIKIRQDDEYAAFLFVRDDATGYNEVFVLWSLDETLPPFSTWIARSLVVALARDALVNKLKVAVTVESTSAIVMQLALLGA